MMRREVSEIRVRDDNDNPDFNTPEWIEAHHRSLDKEVKGLEAATYGVALFGALLAASKFFAGQAVLAGPFQFCMTAGSYLLSCLVAVPMIARCSIVAAWCLRNARSRPIYPPPRRTRLRETLLYLMLLSAPAYLDWYAAYVTVFVDVP